MSYNRYLSLSQFSKYCKEMNVNFSFNHKILERYEKYKVLTPAARIILPKEYFDDREEIDKTSDTYGQPLSDWKNLETLRFQKNENLLNLKILPEHVFDIAFRGNNTFIHNPSEEDFVPWSSFYVDGKDSLGNVLKRNNVEHYYHKWHIHKIYSIRKWYPIFSDHFWILNNLSEKSKKINHHLIPKSSIETNFLDGFEKYYDALSYFIELYKNERNRTFSRIDISDRQKILNDVQFRDYQKRLKKISVYVRDIFKLLNEKLIEFLIHALIKHDEYV